MRGVSPYDERQDEELDDSGWGWGTVVTTDGKPIPPGACDGFHNKDKQRDLLD